MCLQYCYVTTSRPNSVVNYQDIFSVKFCAQCEYSKTCKPICVICIWFCIVSTDPILVILPTHKYAKSVLFFDSDNMVTLIDWLDLSRLCQSTRLQRLSIDFKICCTAANQPHTAAAVGDKTDRRMDTPALHRPCSANYAAASATSIYECYLKTAIKI